MTTTDDISRRLAANDAALGALIERLGPLDMPQPREPFIALARSIVGQQLSVQAASTIWLRVNMGGAVTPQRLADAPEEELRAAGVSRPKIRYLRDLAARVLDGSLDLGRLPSLPDEEVIAELVQVRGIGRWSAEMFLIFALARPDVLALDDVGLLRASGWLLGLGRNAAPSELAEAGERWRPWRSLASMYLWEAIAAGLLREG